MTLLLVRRKGAFLPAKNKITPFIEEYSIGSVFEKVCFFIIKWENVVQSENKTVCKYLFWTTFPSNFEKNKSKSKAKS